MEFALLVARIVFVRGGGQQRLHDLARRRDLDAPHARFGVFLERGRLVARIVFVRGGGKWGLYDLA